MAQPKLLVFCVGEVGCRILAPVRAGGQRDQVAPDLDDRAIARHSNKRARRRDDAVLHKLTRNHVDAPLPQKRTAAGCDGDVILGADTPGHRQALQPGRLAPGQLLGSGGKGEVERARGVVDPQLFRGFGQGILGSSGPRMQSAPASPGWRGGRETSSCSGSFLNPGGSRQGRSALCCRLAADRAAAPAAAVGRCRRSGSARRHAAAQSRPSVSPGSPSPPG